MLMGHPSVQEVRAFKSCLAAFSKASGLEVSPEKSQVFFFNTPLITQRNIGRILGFQKGRLPTKYLGVPLSQKIIRHASWQDLVDRIKSRQSSWVIKPLNLSGRLVLVKSVIQAMPMYLLLVLSTPKLVLKEIRNLQRNFLWVGKGSKAKFSLVSWEKVCLTKKLGGLGSGIEKQWGKCRETRFGGNGAPTNRSHVPRYGT